MYSVSSKVVLERMKRRENTIEVEGYCINWLRVMPNGRL
jgi:hypothetical protein